ncbi:tachykinin-like peptides receptor 99D [Ptychodera flava]|uniref:tachykinin-like peptides receptor 99D n=1 Tax=Ptychodera flava TaxID=63121 RepID=UPI00396A7A65
MMETISTNNVASTVVALYNMKMMDPTTVNITQNSTGNGTDDYDTLDHSSFPDYVNITELVLGIVGTLGNALVILVVLNARRMKTLTNYLILNLAVADLLTSVLLIFNRYLIHVTSLPVPPGIAGQFYCRLYYSAQFFWATIKASTFNLMLVTFERYFALVHSLTYSDCFTKCKVSIMVAISWISACILELTFAVFHRYHEGHCQLFVWPSAFLGMIFGIANFIITYFIPVVFMTWAYYRIISSLKTRARNLHASRRNSSEQARAQARRRVIKMLFLVMIAYVICWTPNKMLFLGHNLGAAIEYNSDYYNVLVLLAFANSILNPFIYVFKYRQFRQSFLAMFYTNSSCCKKEVNQTEINEIPLASMSLSLLAQANNRILQNLQ